jgi:hypothetical protein
MNCLICRNLQRAYETALKEYVEACSSASFHVCSDVAARRNVDMERTKYDLEEHSLVCTSAKFDGCSATTGEHVYELESIG